MTAAPTVDGDALRGGTLYLDCFSGLSGDMLLGALLDLGVPEAVVLSELERLEIPGWRLARARVRRGALEGTKVDFVLDEHTGEHAHTHYGEIRSLLQARIAGDVLRRALDVFERIAAVEARLHGVPVEEVAFHEVGALDSILDIVGCAAALAWLAPRRVVSRTVALGGGTVRTAHGILPVPTPAALELLAGVPVEAGGSDCELTTPTGAALVAGSAVAYGPMPPLTVIGVGWGAGTRELPERPNLLRVVLGHEDETHATAGELRELGLEVERLVLVETNIDDMNPEWAEPLYTALFHAGARDVWQTPIVMKKGRAAVLVSALCEPAARARVTEAMLRHSTSLGARVSSVERVALQRHLIDTETEWGIVPVKVSGRGGEVWNVAPEHEACRRLAAEHGVPVKRVFQAALVAYHEAAGRRGPGR